jgi:hypothetical protein
MRRTREQAPKLSIKRVTEAMAGGKDRCVRFTRSLPLGAHCRPLNAKRVPALKQASSHAAAFPFART